MTLAPLTGRMCNMTKEELIELAEDMIDSNEEPDWEVDLNDLYASVFADVTTEGKCLVIYLNRLTGELEDATLFDTAEEAEDHLNEAQADAQESEEAFDV